MRNLLQFILKYSNFLLFLVLEIAALVLLFNQNDYQKSVYVTSANRVSGQIYETSSAIFSYVHLGEENAALAEENARLQEEVKRLENLVEPYLERESGLINSDLTYVYAQKDVKFIPAKVINTEGGKRRNYLTLNKGTRDGVEIDFGVVDEQGVVGIVSAVSERFSLVIPLINDQMSLSCRFKENQTYGPLEWDGVDYRYARLENIARHATVHVGDTIVTSGLTSAFPEGITVGVVDEAILEESDAYYHIRIRLSTDFHSLGYVQVICNQTLREQQELEGY